MKQAVGEVVKAIAAPTVAVRWREWLAAHERRWSPRYQRGEVRRLGYKHVLAALGSKPLPDVGRAEWIALVAGMRDLPAQAASLYRVVNSFLSYADAVGWIDEHPLPRKGAKRIAPTVAARERTLSDDEAAAVWAATAGMSPRVRCFVRLMMATGCRKSEAAGIAAGEVDFGAGVWALPAARAKNKHGHGMPLPNALAAELATLVPGGDPAALPEYRLLGVQGNRLSGFSKIKLALDAKSGVKDWRFHDLRRTAHAGLRHSVCRRRSLRSASTTSPRG